MAGQTVIVSVLADTKKFSSAMRKLGDETGMSRLADGAKKVGGAFKTATKLVGATALAVTGLALKGGLSRALDTESAILLMKQLKMSTQDIDRVLSDVDKTFDGTPFANPDGFNFSAQLKTSGKALDQIERDLVNVSNVTAMTLDKDFGHISQLFLKMSANGRVTATDLNSISLAGYPIRQILGDALGVSADALGTMVSKGELSYDMLQDLLGGVEDLDGAAKNLGDSTKVSWGNMLTGFSVVGEKFVGQLLPLFRGGFDKIKEWTRSLRKPVEEMGALFAHWVQNVAVPALKKLGDWFQQNKPTIEAFAEKVRDLAVNAFGKAVDIGKQVVDTLKDVVSWVKDNATWIAPLVVAIAAMAAAYSAIIKVMAIWKAATEVAKAAQLAFNAVLNANPISLIIIAVAGLVAGLAYFFTQTETGRRIWDTTWTAIQAGFQAFMDWVGPIMDQLGEAWTIVWENIQMAWDVVGPPLMAAISTAFELIKNNIQTAMELVWGIIQTVWDQIKIHIETIMGVIQGVIKTITSLIKGDWQGAWDGIKQVFSSIIDGIARTAKNIFSGIASSIGTILNGLLRNITSILGSIKDFFSNSWQAVKDNTVKLFTAMKDGAIERAESLLKFVKDIPGKIKDVFSNAPRMLLDAGKKIIDGFLKGITDGFGKVKDKLAELTSFLPDWKGPAETDRTILVKSGNLVIDGFVKGLEDSYVNAHKSLAGFTNTLAVPAPRQALAIPTPRASAAQASTKPQGTAPQPSENLTRKDLEYLANLIINGLSTLAEGAGASLELRANLGRFASV